MIHMLVEAQPCPPYALVDDDRRVTPLEIDTLTAIVISAWQHSNGRRGARLNAFVDGLGHRMVHVDLTPEDYERAVATLQCPGTLVRGTGVLVDEGPHQRLHISQELQFFAPAPGEFP
jgi:hypothetical protein